MSKLNEFRSMIDKVDDIKVLEAGHGLLRDMIQISALKSKLQELEDGLVSDGKAIFYFFAEELDEDEVLFAAERISGRLKRLDREGKEDSES